MPSPLDHCRGLVSRYESREIPTHRGDDRRQRDKRHEQDMIFPLFKVNYYSFHPSALEDERVTGDQVFTLLKILSYESSLRISFFKFLPNSKFRIVNFPPRHLALGPRPVSGEDGGINIRGGV